MHCQVIVEVQGKQIQLEVLAVLEFNSDRKRMSILCRLPDGRSALLQQRPYSSLHVCFQKPKQRQNLDFLYSCSVSLLLTTCCDLDLAVRCQQKLQMHAFSTSKSCQSERPHDLGFD